ncbi:hypothetical protein W822_13415 [Advenella kashmirensis W13003]|uniref:Uncharacterized protein n=1 Tax=Advenella kashmirensis W13003 TaxID=1424334 RepID=V8QSQ4_9BURK|nr:hypothetical protein [Advenella kashmirensis]ETF02360.1 hypothetical protein W822_13415 [Advenella kashmirensis W13003]
MTLEKSRDRHGLLALKTRFGNKTGCRGGVEKFFRPNETKALMNDSNAEPAGLPWLSNLTAFWNKNRFLE